MEIAMKRRDEIKAAAFLETRGMTAPTENDPGDDRKQRAWDAWNDLHGAIIDSVLDVAGISDGD